MFPPAEVLCTLYSMVLCAGISLKSLAMEGVAGGDPVPFLGDSLLETFLYDKVSPNVIRCG